MVRSIRRENNCTRGAFLFLLERQRARRHVAVHFPPSVENICRAVVAKGLEDIGIGAGKFDFFRFVLQDLYLTRSQAL